MNEEELIIPILDKLRNGEIKEHFVKKEDFLSFRQVLVKRDDFKYFQGIAKRGGDIVYRYMEEPRS